MTAAQRYPRYRAPQNSGEVLCVPPRQSIEQQLPHARDDLASSTTQILGIPLGQLATDARLEFLAEALRYTRSYAQDSEFADPAGPLVISGHQPDLYHPGVWIKNFAGDRIAKSVGGTAVNLVIDSDLCRTPSVRVPTGTVKDPQVVNVAFDDSTGDTPYEQREIANDDLWKSFGERVSSTIANLVPGAMAADWWSSTVSPASSARNVGYAIAQARHRLELEWGSRTLEVPQSRVCETQSFHVFTLHLMSKAARLRDEYNAALAEYRTTHRIRNRAQPLPDLQAIGDLIELPFWVWSDDDPTRRKLFVRIVDDVIQLTDRHQWEGTLPFCSAGGAEACLDQFSAWRNQGIKIRTRALMTTLYARLLLADIFIHGIGGGKYDQVTDRISEQFFGVSLPPFAVVSGTLRLPTNHTEVSIGQAGAIQQSLRDLRFHPEAHIDVAAHAESERSQIYDRIDRKRRWVHTPKTAENAAERHVQINAANEQLQRWLTAQREQLETELSATIAQTHINRRLESREYPFCLFPPKLLQDFLLDF